MPGRVTGCLQNLRQRDGAEGQPLPFVDRVGHAAQEFMPAREQSRAGWRAGWADVEIGESETLAMQAIEVGRLQVRVPVAGQITVTLVISHDQDDVRLAAGNFG